MQDNSTILQMREYGHVSVNLKEVMDRKAVTRNQLARAVNTRFEVINKWYAGHVEKIDLDILARICFVLECQVTDILSYDRVDSGQA